MLVQSSCQSSLFIVYFERRTGHMWGSARVNLFILNEKSLNFKMFYHKIVQLEKLLGKISYSF